MSDITICAECKRYIVREREETLLHICAMERIDKFDFGTGGKYTYKTEYEDCYLKNLSGKCKDYIKR